MIWPRRLPCLLLCVYGALSIACNCSLACLRSSMDDRAVQWSTLIVQCKLLSAGPVISMASAPTTRPAAAYQLFQFQVDQCLDGQAKSGDQIQVIRFLQSGGEQASLCGQGQVKDQIGKSFVLLLRPQDQERWSKDTTETDPRTPQINDLKAFIIVHLESLDELGKDGLDDLKYTISDTRGAEAALDPKDANLQAQTLVRAADETEAGQAEHALDEMGPKALDAVKSVAASANDEGRARLDRVIDSISPPPIESAEQPAGMPPAKVQ